MCRVLIVVFFYLDALNVKSVDIKAHSTCGLVGISLTNTSSVTGPDAKFVDAVDTHTLADSSTSAADVFHAVTGLSFTDSQRVNLKPDEAQLSDNKILTQKRFNPQWLSMDERNVSKGVVKSTLVRTRATFAEFRNLLGWLTFFFCRAIKLAI